MSLATTNTWILHFHPLRGLAIVIESSQAARSFLMVRRLELDRVRRRVILCP